MNFRIWFAIEESLAIKGDYKGSIFQRLVAAAYMLAPVFDQNPEVIAGYKDLNQKTKRFSPT